MEFWLWLGTGVRELNIAGGILKIGKSGTFLLVAPQLEVWATNGGYHGIWHTRKVQKYPSTEFLTMVVICEQVGVEFWIWKPENSERFYLWSHNQLCYRKTEATIGFSMFERWGDNLPRGSDCRWWWSLGRVKKCWRNFEFQEKRTIKLIFKWLNLSHTNNNFN
jgi:hypothetical protein